MKAECAEMEVQIFKPEASLTYDQKQSIALNIAEVRFPALERIHLIFRRLVKWGRYPRKKIFLLSVAASYWKNYIKKFFLNILAYNLLI